VEDRQQMGCTFEATIASPGTRHVLSRGGPPMIDWDPPACPLYLARLPALGEVVAALPQWKHGSLAAYCEAEPTRALLSACAALDGAIEAHAHDPNRPREG
jgi:hypothetical protein